MEIRANQVWLVRASVWVCCAAVALLLLFAGLEQRARAQSTGDQQAQRPSEGAQPAAMGGVNTGSPHAAVLDAEHRPITAGGFVKSGR